MPVKSSSSMRRGRALPGSWLGIALIVALPVVLFAAAAIFILSLTVHPVSAQDRIELVKAGLGVGAGTGGVVALVLTGRRQWATEYANRETEHDATERRATELYAKAAEQLGSSYAPVRLAGLYALERLADTHAGQRQTVANLLCAYLRMPFDHRGEFAGAEGEDAGSATLRLGAEHRHEREVRQAAQAILTAHLSTDERPDALTTEHWDKIRLNLVGATLIDFDLGYGSVARADFTGAKFVGDVTEFSYTAFEEGAIFIDVQFLGAASFYCSNFFDATHFSRASFRGHANFRGAHFWHQAFFNESFFGGNANFSEVAFTVGATGAPGVWFNDSRFESVATFREVTAADAVVTFERASFASAIFDKAVFDQGIVGLHEGSATKGISVIDATSVGKNITLNRPSSE